MLFQLEGNDDSLEELISDCETMDMQAAIYVAHLLPHNTCLRKIRLHYNRTSDQKVFHKIVSGITGNTSIASIEILGASFGREEASSLVPTFSRVQTLNHIRMINCNFLGPGLGILLIAMQQNKYIRELTFRCCNWEEHNTDMLASSLPFMNLHSLSLVDVNAAVDGWPYLFRNTETLEQLIHLDLSQNQLEDNAIRLLAKSLAVKNTTSKLSLSSCILNDQSVRVLVKGLWNYSTLTSLDISQNHKMTDKAAILLKDLLKYNNSITELKFDERNFSKQSKAAIESGLRYNNSYLKSLFSETASKAIFGVVDSLERIEIGDSTQLVQAESFDSEALPDKEEMSISRMVRDSTQYLVQAVSFDSGALPDKAEMNISRMVRPTQPKPQRIGPMPELMLQEPNVFRG